MDRARVEAEAKELLDGLATEVDAALDRYLPLETAVPTVIHESMRYSVLAPGKRFRPALHLIAAESLGVPREVALPSACSIELIHAFSLIHDDLPAMDDDELRRGRPTNHVKFGEATAILAGDALCSLAFELIGRETTRKHLVPDLVSVLGRAVGTNGMIGGQVLDLLGEERQPDLDLVREIHRRKTAALICAACSMAAVLAEASEPMNRSLTRYGESVGLAFQVIDDVLDQTASEQDMGKKTRKDQERGKQTWPACVGVEEARTTASRLIDEALAAIDGVLPETGSLELLARFILLRVF